MSLNEELATLRKELAERAALGDQLVTKREMEHFMSFRSLREVTEAAGHLERSGWQVDRTEGQDANSRYLLRAYREQTLDVESAEQALRGVYAITDKHGGSYDGFGARLITAEGSEPQGFFGRLFGTP
ncbi:ribonuclease E inhibitor RraB [Paeniglutamicibacter antarcticus]|uniref:Regulator of ribonuclease activity B domain-containing protein n=1 Tax=Paeniglutamicibacter antarcticus TaxID=494023 RepID=A0ABP9TI32_9MICC